MPDPGLKLPLEIEVDSEDDALSIFGADGTFIASVSVGVTPESKHAAQHVAGVFKAALTADAEGKGVRTAALLEAADEIDRMWDDQVSQRPMVNYLRKGLDSAYRQAAKRLREMARQCTCLAVGCRICAQGAGASLTADAAVHESWCPVARGEKEPSDGEHRWVPARCRCKRTMTADAEKEVKGG